MTTEEWESLCDGCGRCCMVKLEDEDNGDIYLTRLSCSMLAACQDVPVLGLQKPIQEDVGLHRSDGGEAQGAFVAADVVRLRRVAEGRDLAWWHPLVSGSPDTVHAAGISVANLAMNERRVKEENYLRYIIPDFDSG